MRRWKTVTNNSRCSLKMLQCFLPLLNSVVINKLSPFRDIIKWIIKGEGCLKFFIHNLQIICTSILLNNLELSVRLIIMLNANHNSLRSQSRSKSIIILRISSGQSKQALKLKRHAVLFRMWPKSPKCKSDKNASTQTRIQKSHFNSSSKIRDFLDHQKFSVPYMMRIQAVNSVKFSW